MARLLFTRDGYLSSLTVRLATWSDWSHVQAFETADTLIGAGWPQGVARQKLSSALDEASAAIVMTIPTPDEPAGQAWLASQLGKPYDLRGALGLGLHRDWQDSGQWWCSELVAAWIQESGKPLFREGVLNRITPQHLWMLPYKIEVLK